jgi:nucleoside-diphosphate-sugar epimerase
MRVLVIGGNGFIGQYLCGVLEESQNCDVIVTHRRNLDFNERKNGMTYFNIDLNRPSCTLGELMCDVDVVVIAIQPNITHARRIQEAIRSSYTLKKIVYLSTIMVYPDSSMPQDESTQPDVLTEYEMNKLREEKLFKTFVQDSDCVLCIARLGNVYGDVKDLGIVNYIIKALLEDKIFTVNSDGSIVRDYIHLNDASMALASLVTCQQGEKVSIYNVSNGKGHSISRLIEILESQTDATLAVQHVPAKVEKHSVIGDITKLINLLQRRPRYNLDTGLSLAVKMYEGKYEKTV